MKTARLELHSDRGPIALVLAISALVVTVHALGAALLRDRLWGTHAYAFLGPWTLGGAMAGLAVAMAAALSVRPPAFRAPRWARSRAARIALDLALAAGAFALLWGLRARHLFLGDGLALVQSIPGQEDFHPLEPLSAILQRSLYDVAGSPFARAGRTPAEVAWDTAALGSALAGVLFVFTARAVAGEIVRSSARARGEAAGAGTEALVTLVLVAQGYVQLFFGYVENYAFLTLAIAYYLATGLAYVNGRGSLLRPLATCVAAVCLHLSATALLPSLAVLVAWGVAGRERRSAALADLVTGAVILTVVTALISTLGSGYDPARTLGGTLARIAGGDGELPGYRFSLRHVLDAVNLQLLVGPFALGLFVPALLLSPWSRRPDRGRVFLGTAGLAYTLVAIVAGDSNLGYARNWDLLAPGALVLTAGGMHLLLERPCAPPSRARLLVVVAAVSLFHTAPWVTLNASFDRSFERFKTLRLGGGRTESTVGYWYATHGRLDEAERWLVRALEANPANHRAHHTLGTVYMETGRPRAAIQAFTAARLLRPESEAFRLALIDALVTGGEGDAALEEAQELIAGQPTDARRWAIAGVILMGLGRPIESREAMARATTLAPGEPAYRAILRTLGLPQGYQQTLRRHWVELVTM